MTAFTESIVEDAALSWLEAIGWRVAHGPDIAPDMTVAGRANYGEVVPGTRMRDALLRRLLSGDRRAKGAEQFIGSTV